MRARVSPALRGLARAGAGGRGLGFRASGHAGAGPAGDPAILSSAVDTTSASPRHDVSPAGEACDMRDVHQDRHDIRPAPPRRRAPVVRARRLATSMAFIVGQLDVTIVNVALPAMARDLGAGVAGLQWVVDAYAVGLRRVHAVGRRARRPLRRAARVPVRHGACSRWRRSPAPPRPASWRWTRRACCRAWARRMMLPNSLALLNHALAHDQEQRARGIGWWTAAGAISIALGPVLGGLLVASVGLARHLLGQRAAVPLGGWLATRLDETRATRRAAAAGHRRPGAGHVRAGRVDRHADRVARARRARSAPVAGRGARRWCWRPRCCWSSGAPPRR